MGKATVRIPTPLRGFTGGAGEVQVDGLTVGEVLAALGQRHAGILERVLDAEGRIRGFVNIYVGERNVKSLGGLDARLDESAVISIVPAVAGGRP
jgi:molybdopterin converting factor small subunit